MPPFEDLNPSDYVSGEMWFNSPASVPGGYGGIYFPTPATALGNALLIAGEYVMLTLRPATHLPNRVLYGYVYAGIATGGNDTTVTIEVRIYVPFSQKPIVYPLSTFVNPGNVPLQSLSNVFYQGSGIDALAITIGPAPTDLLTGYTYNEGNTATLQPIRLYNSQIDHIDIVNTTPVFKNTISAAAVHCFVSCRSNQ